MPENFERWVLVRVDRAGSAILRQHGAGQNLLVLAGSLASLIQRGFVRHFVPIDAGFSARVFPLDWRQERVAAGQGQDQQ